MNLHDAVLESAGVVKTGEFRVILSEIPHQPEGMTLVLEVRGAMMVLMSGNIEPDWFLSGVTLTSPSGDLLELPAPPATRVGRLIVQGTNGAFIEVIGGELQCSTAPR